MASQGAKCGKMYQKNEYDYSSDPLDFEFSESELPSVRTRIPRDFTIITDSYTSLCSRVYAAWCTTHSDIAKTIPESAFQYYATILLWKRFAELLPAPTAIESAFVNDIKCITNPSYLHVLLQTYLKGIGYFRDPDGCDRRFRLPVLPTCEKIGGIPYTFGRVNAITHFLYESFPAPGIATLRILADIKYTQNACEQNLIWDLPEGLRPDIQASHVESIKPTKNLLGWAPAQCLTKSQLEFVQSLEIDDNFLENSPSTAGVNKLFTQIDYYLNSFNKYYESCKVVDFASLPTVGSLTQGVTVEKYNEVSKFDRSAMYCAGNISVCSPYKLNDKLSKAAAVSGYRMRKEAIANKHCWSCYDFDKYKHVPESWVRSRKTMYTYGEIGRLNETIYTTGHVSKRLLQNECIQHSMFKSPTRWNATP